MDWLKAWGEVTERTFARMVVNPDWNIPPVAGAQGKDYPVVIETCCPMPTSILPTGTKPATFPSAKASSILKITRFI